ncbi:uncharacterized protein DNG_01689 [Cephalotrichum gorgonifer]|uniref:Heterokaryon incompatibility domain-containing protein n=1 Tax=Cephalotrichum gorgonifer TaxID=2041049 RepID=A0AAE8SSH1_9PEZI|nr:uncharacterized protein DNG_01689 [Cephalotrichum gorgonifer]
MPFFEAISYVWGAPENPIPILCDKRSINITRNLHEVLLQIRSPTEPRSLWADAICINQNDIVERGQQVSLMGELYTRANRVLVCLGMDPDYHEEADAMAGLLSATDKMILSTLAKTQVDWDTFPETDPDNPLLKDERWEAMRALFDQPWFERGWVVQEVWMNRDVKVLWGNSQFKWLALVRAYSWMTARATEIHSRYNLTLLRTHMTQYTLRHENEAIPLMTHKPNPYFPGVMDATRGLQLTDPRDRIYAFMSLALPGEMPSNLRPDYTKPHLEVYQGFASEYITTGNDLGILALVDHGHSTLAGAYPSWVPRWDIRITLENIKAFSHPLPGNVLATVSNGVLKVRGTIIGTVEFVSADIHWVMSGISDIIRILSDLADTQIATPYRDMPALWAFVNILVAGLQPRGRQTWKADRAAYILRLLEGNVPGMDIPDHQFERDGKGGNIAVFHSWVRAWGHTRRIIQTDRGYFGLAPGVVARGDLVCAIAGATTLMCLRELGNGTYKLVGPTHIAGTQQRADGDPIALGAESIPVWSEWGQEEEMSIY